VSGGLVLPLLRPMCAQQARQCPAALLKPVGALRRHSPAASSVSSIISTAFLVSILFVCASVCLHSVSIRESPIMSLNVCVSVSPCVCLSVVCLSLVFV